jgi:hypothetical protein
MKMKVVFCTNLEEVFGSRLDSEMDQQNEEWQREVIDDALKLGRKLLPDDCDDDESSTFADWNGGRFSSQAEMYGYKKLGFIAYSKDLDGEAMEKIEHAYSVAIDMAIAGANRQEAEEERKGNQ